jgi:hypothetical protein
MTDGTNGQLRVLKEQIVVLQLDRAARMAETAEQARAAYCSSDKQNQLQLRAKLISAASDADEAAAAAGRSLPFPDALGPEPAAPSCH